MGYNSRWIKRNAEKWGLDEDQTVWLPKGLVIPAFMDTDLWYLKIRIFDHQGMPVKKVKGKSKYLQVLGSRPVLFGKHLFSGQENLFLAESELDVILAWQEGKHIFDLASLEVLSKRLQVSISPAEDLCAFYQEGGDLRKWLQSLMS